MKTDEEILNWVAINLRREVKALPIQWVGYEENEMPEKYLIKWTPQLALQVATDLERIAKALSTPPHPCLRNPVRVA